MGMIYDECVTLVIITGTTKQPSADPNPNDSLPRSSDQTPFQQGIQNFITWVIQGNKEVIYTVINQD